MSTTPALLCHEGTMQFRKVLLASYQIPGNNNLFYVTAAEILEPGHTRFSATATC